MIFEQLRGHLKQNHDEMWSNTGPWYILYKHKSSTNLLQIKHNVPGLICQKCKIEGEGSVAYVAPRQKDKCFWDISNRSFMKDPYEDNCTIFPTSLAHWAAQLLLDIFPCQLVLQLMLVISCIHWAAQLLLDIFPCQLFLPLMLIISWMHKSAYRQDLRNRNWTTSCLVGLATT